MKKSNKRSLTFSQAPCKLNKPHAVTFSRTAVLVNVCGCGSGEREDRIHYARYHIRYEMNAFALPRAYGRFFNKPHLFARYIPGLTKQAHELTHIDPHKYKQAAKDVSPMPHDFFQYKRHYVVYGLSHAKLRLGKRLCDNILDTQSIKNRGGQKKRKLNLCPPRLLLFVMTAGL